MSQGSTLVEVIDDEVDVFGVLRIVKIVVYGNIDVPDEPISCSAMAGI
jgi:hypothetical protein